MVVLLGFVPWFLWNKTNKKRFFAFFLGFFAEKSVFLSNFRLCFSNDFFPFTASFRWVSGDKSRYIRAHFASPFSINISVKNTFIFLQKSSRPRRLMAPRPASFFPPPGPVSSESVPGAWSGRSVPPGGLPPRGFSAHRPRSSARSRRPGDAVPAPVPAPRYPRCPAFCGPARGQ